jgi:hypothetical protein
MERNKSHETIAQFSSSPARIAETIALQIAKTTRIAGVLSKIELSSFGGRGYNPIIMGAILHHLTVLIMSAVLALPPGACFVLEALKGSSQSPVKVSCCHSAKHKTPCEPEKSPLSIKCCCVQDSTVPETTIKLDLLAAMIVAILEPLSLDEGSLTLPCVGEYFQPIDPSLHVLHCVWRC